MANQLYSIRLPPSAMKKLRLMAKRTGVTIGEIVTRLLRGK